MLKRFVNAGEIAFTGSQLQGSLPLAQIPVAAGRNGELYG